MGTTVMRAAIFSSILALALGAGVASAQEQGPPVVAPWCETTGAEASADSMQMNLVFVPSEYAQVKSRSILEFAPFTALTKEMAADLGVPAKYVQPNAYLVRAGGFFQPEGDPGRQVEAYFDPGTGMLQIDSFASSTSLEPVNWAAVVVTAGEVTNARAVCVATTAGR